MTLRLKSILTILGLALVAAAFSQGVAAPDSLKEDGLGPFLGAAIGAALLALLTPCVFPIIPVTVSYFAKQAEKNPGQKLSGPIAYCLGIISTFTIVGVGFAAAFGAAKLNTVAQHPITNITLGILFVVLALNLFGVFEIGLPSWLVNTANKGRTKGGLIGPFMMGLTFALTSFTCTVAFVGGLLALAADKNFVAPIIGMLAFSITFALPFFFLALFPGFLAKMPKSGGWMQTVKGYMGFLELAAALKFFQNADIVEKWGLLTKPVFLSIWFALLLLAGIYLLGWMTLAGHDEGKPGPFRWAFAIMSFGAAFAMLAGLQGKSLGYVDGALPPSKYPYRLAAGQTEPVEVGELEWFTNDFPGAAAKAKAENKLILIDFTGYT